MFLSSLPWDLSRVGTVLHQALSASSKMLNPFASGWSSKMRDFRVLQNLCLAGTGWEEQRALGAALTEITAITISFLISSNQALLPDGFGLGYHF